MSTFPFNPHKGKPWDQVPESFLSWCLAKMESLRPETRRLIQRELARRRGELPLEPVTPEPVAGVAELERKLAARADAVARRAFSQALAFIRSLPE